MIFFSPLLRYPFQPLEKPGSRQVATKITYMSIATDTSPTSIERKQDKSSLEDWPNNAVGLARSLTPPEAVERPPGAQMFADGPKRFKYARPVGKSDAFGAAQWLSIPMD
jgi:hypothetical protein